MNTRSKVDWFIIIVVLYLFLAFMTQQARYPDAEPYNRCGEGMHMETYVQAGGAEHDICVWN
jgi:hypothetical protein